METPLSLADLTALDTDSLRALALTDAHIAVLDAADCVRRAESETNGYERARLIAQAGRHMGWAGGVTVADAARLLGYWPAGARQPDASEAARG